LVNWAQWYFPTIPATWEAAVGKLSSKLAWAAIVRLYLKTNITKSPNWWRCLSGDRERLWRDREWIYRRVLLQDVLNTSCGIRKRLIRVTRGHALRYRSGQGKQQPLWEEHTSSLDLPFHLPYGHESNNLWRETSILTLRELVKTHCSLGRKQQTKHNTLEENQDHVLD
jgi:hypothetical protein